MAKVGPAIPATADDIPIADTREPTPAVTTSEGDRDRLCLLSGLKATRPTIDIVFDLVVVVVIVGGRCRSFLGLIKGDK